MKSFAKRFLDKLSPWFLPIGLILIWQISSSLGTLSNQTLPSPIDVLKAAITQTQSGVLLENLKISFLRAITGFVIGGSLGLLFGTINGSSKSAQKYLDTTIQMLRNIPNLAMIPLVIIWFGVGEEGKVFLVAISVFFPIYINTYHGIKLVDPKFIEIGKIYGLSKIKLFYKVIFLGALPSILVGIRYALGVMWLTLIVAETVAASSGIGYMSMNAREFMQLDVVVLSILLYSLLGKIADSLAKLLEYQLLSWNPVYRRSRRED